MNKLCNDSVIWSGIKFFSLRMTSQVFAFLEEYVAVVFRSLLQNHFNISFVIICTISMSSYHICFLKFRTCGRSAFIKTNKNPHEHENGFYNTSHLVALNNIGDAVWKFFLTIPGRVVPTVCFSNTGGCHISVLRRVNETTHATGNERHQGNSYLKRGVRISSPDEKQVHMVWTHWNRIQRNRNLRVWDTPSSQ